MGYFANSTEGSVFDYQCSLCKYEDKGCPIHAVQMLFNYDAAENDVATKILGFLVKDNGTCEMWKTFKNDFRIDSGCSDQEIEFLDV